MSLNTKELANRILSAAKADAAKHHTIQNDTAEANQVRLNRLQDQFDENVSSICNLFREISVAAPAFEYSERYDAARDLPDRPMINQIVRISCAGRYFEAEVRLTGGYYRSLSGGYQWSEETWRSCDVPDMKVIIELTAGEIRATDSGDNLFVREHMRTVTFHELSSSLERWATACLSTLPAAKQS